MESTEYSGMVKDPGREGKPNVESGPMVEFIECSCGEFLHTIRCSCFLDDDDPEDNVIYVEAYIRQWRTSKVPPLWDNYSYAAPNIRVGCFLYKECWKQYYRRSVWARIAIALRYLLSPQDEKDGVFDCTLIKDDDLPRLDRLLANLTEEIVPCTCCDIDGKSYRLQFFIDEENANISAMLTTRFQFKKHSFFKRLWVAMLYALGNDKSRSGEIDVFAVDREHAAQMRGLIRDVRQMAGQTTCHKSIG